MLARIARRSPLAPVRRFATEAKIETVPREELESKRYGHLWHKWFPYDPVPVSPQIAPYIVNVQGGHGETYSWCACGESSTQPWCNGVCDKFEKKGIWKAVQYMPRRDGYKLLCGCKYAVNRPKCDGSCTTMYCDHYPLQAAGVIFGLSFTFSVFMSFLYHP